MSNEIEVQSDADASGLLERLRDAWSQLSTVYEPNMEGQPEVVIEAKLQAELEKTCRSLSHALLAWQGGYHNEKKSRHEVRLEIREIARRTGSGEPMHRPLLDVIKIDGVSEVDETSLPEEMQGYRSTFFVQGWNVARSACSAAESSRSPGASNEALRDATNPYPDQSFRSAEFCGGWNEYMRRRS